MSSGGLNKLIFIAGAADAVKCPECSAALLCGAAVRKNCLAFHQELDEVGMTLVDW